MPSFFDTDPKDLPNDLESYLDYLKPKSHEEFTRSLLQHWKGSPQKKGGHPDKSGVRDLLRGMGIDPEKFAELALSQPELWTKEELDLLSALSVDAIGLDQIADLVASYPLRQNQKPAPTPSLTRISEPEEHVPSSPDFEPVHLTDGDMESAGTAWWKK